MKQIPLNRPFRDRTALEAEGINPYVASHLDFPEIIPAEQAEGWKGRWSEAFGTPGPVHLEIGSGNGFYLSGMAAAHPEIRWVGLEIRFKRVVLAARKLQAAKLNNAKLLRFDAFNLQRVFADGDLASVHINHPDPWPKDKQAHRRLISPPVLAQLTRFVRSGGELRLKTDFRPHVDALLESISSASIAAEFPDLSGAWTVVGTSDSVRDQGAPWPNDVRTNYQRKFEDQGLPVYAAWLRRS